MLVLLGTQVDSWSEKLLRRPLRVSKGVLSTLEDEGDDMVLEGKMMSSKSNACECCWQFPV